MLNRRASTTRVFSRRRWNFDRPFRNIARDTVACIVRILNLNAEHENMIVFTIEQFGIYASTIDAII